MKAGDSVKCRKCGNRHELENGVLMQPTDDAGHQVSRGPLLYYRCGDTHYAVFEAETHEEIPGAEKA